MAEFEVISLPLIGYGSRDISNRFFSQLDPAEELAILLPGLNYTCDMPLLYYPTRLLLGRGADVLQLFTDYTTPAFQGASPREQAKRMAEDARAALHTGRSQRLYRRLILVGKSIGTLALAQLINEENCVDATTIWLTPLLRQPPVVRAASRCTGPALFVVGTGDATYDPAVLEKIRQQTNAQALVIESVDHSLELRRDPITSLQVMQTVVRGIADFLNA